MNLFTGSTSHTIIKSSKNKKVQKSTLIIKKKRLDKMND